MKYLNKSDLREERFILTYSSERVQSTTVGEDAVAARGSVVTEPTEEEKINGFLENGSPPSNPLFLSGSQL